MSEAQGTAMTSHTDLVSPEEGTKAMLDEDDLLDAQHVADMLRVGGDQSEDAPEVIERVIVAYRQTLQAEGDSKGEQV